MFANCFETLQRCARPLIAVPMICALSTVTFAQSTVESHSDKSENQAELEEVKTQLEGAKTRQNALKAEIASLGKDIGVINRALITTTNSSQALEIEATNAEELLFQSTQNQKSVLNRLSTKRALLGEVLAALQRMGRKPPPAILIRPEDALASVRSAIVLGSVVPEIRAETDILLAELSELKKVTEEVEARKIVLTDKLNKLSEDETRLTLLIEEKSGLTRKSKIELQKQEAMAANLAEKATSLEDLIDILESQIEAAAKAAKSAKLADARRAENEANRLKTAQQRLKDLNAAKNNTSRIEPAIAFTQAKGTLLQPVAGVKIHDFGSPATSKSDAAFVLGSKYQNIAFQTRSNARVRSPADGWVVYAGPFRSYGHLLILNAGEGYHIVLSGLNQVNVETGRFVLAGEPVGRMGLSKLSSGLDINLGSNNPILYVEFRKDGKPIDSAPWWDTRTATHLNTGDG